jgi:hypothetical protein
MCDNFLLKDNRFFNDESDAKPHTDKIFPTRMDPNAKKLPVCGKGYCKLMEERFCLLFKRQQ